MKETFVLVDSSVWIDYFRGIPNPALENLISYDLICTNQLILTEIVPRLELKKRTEMIQTLKTLPTIKLDVDWDIIRKLQLINLQNGINKVGIPDLMIAQQIIESGFPLFTFDKHFKLMQPHFGFTLFDN